jgi:hypothetical protein
MENTLKISSFVYGAEYFIVLIRLFVIIADSKVQLVEPAHIVMVIHSTYTCSSSMYVRQLQHNIEPSIQSI